MVGGLLLIVAGNRVTAMLGGWVAVAAGAWFVVGGEVAPLLGIGSAGDPIAATERKRAALEVTYFSGLGALIVFVAGVAVARTAVRLACDVEPLEPVRAVAAVPGPYEVSPDALTAPRVESESKSRGVRRSRAAAPAGSGANYLRWPHPQR